MLNNKQKIFSLLLVLATSIIYGHNDLKTKSLLNKWFCALAESKPISLFESKLVAKGCNLIMPCMLGNESAAQEYQDLGKEAQFDLGIPEEYHVPIKKIPKVYCTMPVGGFTISGAIYVNEDRLNTAAYGTKRSVIFHEAVHAKYKDFTFFMAIDLISSLGGGFLAHKLLMHLKSDLSKWVHYPIVFLSVCGSPNLVLYGLRFKHYLERRADIEGHYATQCSECVQESANRRRQIFEVENHSMRNDGYLFADSLEQIAQQFKSENKLCKYHQNEALHELEVAVSH